LTDFLPPADPRNRPPESGRKTEERAGPSGGSRSPYSRQLGITSRFKALAQNAPEAAGARAPMRILCVEDSDIDFELMQYALRSAGLAHTATRVEDEAGMSEALAAGTWDVVISDHNLPRFSSAAALKVLRRVEPDTPFLIVSGAIGEDAAVAALQAGADDYLMKNSLKRLAPAIEHALAAANDRRKRRAAQDELRDSLDYLRTVLTASPIAIITLDSNLRISLFNAAAERIFRIDRDAIGATPQSITDPANQRVLERLRDAIRHGPVQNIEETWIRGDGAARDFTFAAARLGEDESAGAVVFVADNTEQKQAELTQRETETRFAAISENLPGVVFQMLARPAQRLLLMPFVSAGATHLFNIAPADFLANPSRFTDLLDLVDREHMFDALNKAIDTGSFLEGQWQIARADGSRRWIQLSATAREANGGNWLFDGIITDITPQKETERELTSSREELRELTAHIEALKEEERRAVAREIHDDIGSTLARMKADLAWLARHHGDNAEIAAKIASMTELADGAVQTANRIVQALRPGILDYGIAPALEWQAKDFASHNGIEVSFETNDEELVLDIEQSTALFRVFQESLTNVSKYARATRVETELFATPTSVTLEVRDNGAGFRAGDLMKPTSFGIRGMMERVRALGGWLDISGPAGKGTTVMLSIPRRRPGAAGAAATDSEQEAAAGAPYQTRSLLDATTTYRQGTTT
jgi:two-component system sensor histidine kinase UhpB